MCGIVGYIGDKQAAPILLKGLEKLEYRGYDSAGIAVRDDKNLADVVKSKGKLTNLQEKTNFGKAMTGKCGIGHTRWATHGAPSTQNAHPHVSGNCANSGNGEVLSNVVGVHNGIIENFQELKEKLQKNNYKIYSETDTEIAIKIIDYYYQKYKMGPIDALSKAMIRIRGSYALEVMFKDYPNEIYVARKDSPMIIGIKNNETFVASDVPAILNHTRKVHYIENLQMARLTAGNVKFYDLNGDVTDNKEVEIHLSEESAEKGGFEHFMMKEIHEQPLAVANTIKYLINKNDFNYKTLALDKETAKQIKEIQIVACGSAWHAGIVSQYVIEDLAKIPVRVELGSEFRYRNPLISKNTLVIVISQSGETADSLAALREAKKRGAKTLAIVNVAGSSIAREADFFIQTQAGPEIAVATTKGYTTQLIVIYILSLYFAKLHKLIDKDKLKYYIEELNKIPSKIKRILEDKERLQWFASKFANHKDIFFIGRGLDYALCLEGSLKMKEISYVHSEAYAAGELKHGTISLLEKGTPVIGVITQSSLRKKTVSNMVECKSRGAYLMGLATYGNYEIEDTADFVVYVPKIDEHFAGSLAVVPMQLLGYYVSVSRGLDVDKPRNLAKSVTVE